MSFEERLEGLSEGRYDVIAYGILATSKLKSRIVFVNHRNSMKDRISAHVG